MGLNDTGQLNFQATIDDQATPQVKKLQEALEKAGASPYQIKVMVQAVDEATPKIQEAQKTADRLPKEKILNVKANVDEAVRGLNRIKEKWEDFKRGTSDHEVKITFKDNLKEKMAEMRAKSNEYVALPLAGALPMSIGYNLYWGLGAGAIVTGGMAAKSLASGAVGAAQQNQQLMYGMQNAVPNATQSQGILNKLGAASSNSPFAYNDLAQSEITLRRNLALPGSQQQARDLAANYPGTTVNSAAQAITAAQSGDFSGLQKLGVPIDSAAFQRGGRFSGMSIGQGIQQSLGQFSQGAEKQQSNTLIGVMQELKNTFQQRILRPLGTAPYGGLTSMGQNLNQWMQKPQTEQHIGKDIENVQRGMAKLWDEVKKGKDYFNEHLKKPLEEVIQMIVKAGSAFARAFGGTLISMLRTVSETITALVKPITTLIGNNQALVGFLGTMKALSLLGFGNITKPFTTLLNPINAIHAGFGGILRSLLQLPSAITKLGLVLLVKNFIDAKEAAKQLDDQFQSLGKKGGGFDDLNAKVSEMAYGLGISAKNAKELTTTAAMNIPVAVPNREHASMQIASRAAMLQYQYGVGDKDAATLLSRHASQTHQFDDKSIEKFAMQIAQAADAAKHMGMKFKDVTNIMEVFAKQAGPAGLGGMRGAPMLSALVKGTNALPLTRAQENMGIYSGDDLARYMMDTYAHPSLQFLQQAGGPGFSGLGKVYPFKSGAKLPPGGMLSRDQQGRAAAANDARIRSTISAIAPTAQLPDMGPNWNQLESGMGPSFQQIQGQKDPSKQAQLVAQAWQKTDQVLQQMNKDLDQMNSKLQSQQNTLQAYEQAQASVNMQLEKYQHQIELANRAVQDAQLAEQEYEFKALRPLEEALTRLEQSAARVSNTMQVSQYDMGKYADGLLTGEQAALDNVHALEQYNKQLQLLQLYNQQLGAELGVRTYERGYSSTVKPLMGLDLEWQMQQLQRKQQEAQLQYDLKFGEGHYQMQQAARTQFQRSEMPLNTRLSHITADTHTMDQATRQQFQLGQQQFQLQDKMATVNQVIQKQTDHITSLSLSVQKMEQSGYMRKLQDEQYSLGLAVESTNMDIQKQQNLIDNYKNQADQVRQRESDLQNIFGAIIDPGKGGPNATLNRVRDAFSNMNVSGHLTPDQNKAISQYQAEALAGQVEAKKNGLTTRKGWLDIIMNGVKGAITGDLFRGLGDWVQKNIGNPMGIGGLGSLTGTVAQIATILISTGIIATLAKWVFTFAVGTLLAKPARPIFRGVSRAAGAAAEHTGGGRIHDFFSSRADKYGGYADHPSNLGRDVANREGGLGTRILKQFNLLRRGRSALGGALGGGIGALVGSIFGPAGSLLGGLGGAKLGSRALEPSLRKPAEDIKKAASTMSQSVKVGRDTATRMATSVKNEAINVRNHGASIVRFGKESKQSADIVRGASVRASSTVHRQGLATDRFGKHSDNFGVHVKDEGGHIGTFGDHIGTQGHSIEAFLNHVREYGKGVRGMLGAVATLAGAAGLFQGAVNSLKTVFDDFGKFLHDHLPGFRGAVGAANKAKAAVHAAQGSGGLFGSIIHAEDPHAHIVTPHLTDPGGFFKNVVGGAMDSRPGQAVRRGAAAVGRGAARAGRGAARAGRAAGRGTQRGAQMTAEQAKRVMEHNPRIQAALKFGGRAAGHALQVANLGFLAYDLIKGDWPNVANDILTSVPIVGPALAISEAIVEVFGGDPAQGYGGAAGGDSPVPLGPDVDQRKAIAIAQMGAIIRKRLQHAQTTPPSGPAGGQYGAGPPPYSRAPGGGYYDGQNKWHPGNPPRSHASGLARVPKDNYSANLHKDEMVLTAAQAAQWREKIHGNKPSKHKSNEESIAGDFSDILDLARSNVVNKVQVGSTLSQLTALRQAAGGIPDVPYDGYLTLLHQNEMVLQAGEAQSYRNRAQHGTRGGSSGNATQTTELDTFLATVQKKTIDHHKKLTDESGTYINQKQKESKNYRDDELKKLDQFNTDGFNRTHDNLKSILDMHNQHFQDRVKVITDGQTKSYGAENTGYQNINHITGVWLKKIEKQVNGIPSALGLTSTPGASGSKPPGHMTGGHLKADPHSVGPGRLIRVNEEGHDEMIIPLAPHRRDHAKHLLAQTAAHLGMHRRIPGFAAGGYVNPMKDASGIVPERIDMGVDYAFSVGSLLDSIGKAKVNIAQSSGSGWPGGGYINMTLLEGPARGKSWYLAEDIAPLVKAGDIVNPGQHIARYMGGSSGTEWGWAAGPTNQTLAASLSEQAAGDPGGHASAAGKSFSDFLHSLGAPAGVLSGSVFGKLPKTWGSLAGLGLIPGAPLQLKGMGVVGHKLYDALHKLQGKWNTQLSAQSSGGSVGAVGNISGQSDFAKALLKALGVPVSQSNIAAIVGWELAEGGNWNNAAKFNPLNTTQPEPGAGNTGSQGNIKVYKNWQQGVQATVDTLRNGNYSGILSALRSGNSTEAVARAIGSSPWGTSASSVMSTIASAAASLHTHAGGRRRVPYDNYPALLHQDEAVLTAAEAHNYRNNITLPTDATKSLTGGADGDLEVKIVQMTKDISDIDDKIKKAEKHLAAIKDQGAKKDTTQLLHNLNMEERLKRAEQLRMQGRSDKGLAHRIAIAGDPSDGERTAGLVSGEKQTFQTFINQAKHAPEIVAINKKIHSEIGKIHSLQKHISAERKHHKPVPKKQIQHLNWLKTQLKRDEHIRGQLLAETKRRARANYVADAASRGINPDLMRQITGKGLSAGEKAIYNQLAKLYSEGKGNTKQARALHDRLYKAIISEGKKAAARHHETKAQRNAHHNHASKQRDNHIKVVSANHAETMKSRAERAKEAAKRHTESIKAANEGHNLSRKAESRKTSRDNQFDKRDRQWQNTALRHLENIAKKEMSVGIHNTAVGATLTTKTQRTGRYSR